MCESITKYDNLTHISNALTDLYETMSVIYEGLYKGGMEEASPHCILTLQSAVEDIIHLVEEERQRIKKEGHED